MWTKSPREGIEEREGMRKDCGKETTSTSPRAHARWNRRGFDRGWIAPAPSVSSLRFIPPFPPSFNNSPLLISHPTPLSSPLVRFLSPCRFFPFPSSLVFPVVSRLSSRFSVAPFAFPFLPPRLSLSSFSDFIPPSLFPPHRASLFLCLRFPFFFLSLVGQFHPLSIRCSLFARVTHRRGETIRRFPGWHLVSRAAFFLSIARSLFRLSAFTAEADCYRWPVGRRAHTIGGS